jgi:hypothetical protein
VLGLQRAAGNRVVTSLLARARDARVPVVQRDGGLVVPPAVTPTYRSDKDIRIGKRASGGGETADVVKVDAATPVFDVAESDGTKPEGVPKGLYMPVVNKFYGTEQKVADASAGDVASLAGDWMEPVVPAAFARMYAVTPLGTLYTPQTTERALPLAAPFGAISADAAHVFTADRPEAATFGPEVGDLFAAGHPLIEDIRQGELADCGFLAALTSIMVFQPDFPHRIMRKDGPKVTVKMFDIVLEETGKRFEPRYITIDATSVKDTAGDDKFAQGALWVKMMEKAYIAAGFLATQKALTTSYTYANLESMNLDIALGHLVGQSSQVRELKARTKVAPPGALPGAADKYPAKGALSPAEEETAHMISDGLAAKKAVLVETRAEITKKVVGRGHSGGEQVHRGLVGGHAYAVVGMTDPGVTPVMVQLRNPWGRYGAQYSGATGSQKLVENEPNNPALAAPGSGVFSIDLHDLHRRFLKLTVSEGTLGPAREVLDTVGRLRAGLRDRSDQRALRGIIGEASRAWTGLSSGDRALARREVIGALDEFCMQVEHRRPSQAALGDTFGFPGLTAA